MQIIDKEALDDFIQGDHELLGDLASMFTQYLPDMQARMCLAITDRDASALRESAHQMKARLGYFQAASLQEIAAQLEKQAQAGELDAASQTLRRLLDGCQRLLGELRVYTGLSLNTCDE